MNMDNYSDGLARVTLNKNMDILTANGLQLIKMEI